MQRHLYYPPTAGQQPEVTMIYTPNLEEPGYPSDRAIFVDLEAGITRVFNSDCFGESKKGGLRMWNRKEHEAGGLPIDARCQGITASSGAPADAHRGAIATGK